jgi:hypothetical protein
MTLTGEDLKTRTDNYLTITTPYSYAEKDEEGNLTGNTIKTGIWKNCYMFVSTNNYFDTKVKSTTRCRYNFSLPRKIYLHPDGVSSTSG